MNILGLGEANESAIVFIKKALKVKFPFYF